ncbi:MAG: peroxiredoxin-like family protein [Bacteriovoracia bacterium]
MNSLKQRVYTSLFLTVLIPMLVTAGVATEPAVKTAEKSLTEQLHEKVEAAKAKTPSEKRKIMDGAIDQLRKSHLVDHALKKGDTVPRFQLPNVDGKSIDTNSLFEHGPLVIVFYRGGWCPYCNLQLHDLQKHLEKIQALGAQLIAISPQTPNNSLTTAQKAELKFYVLSDVGNKIAKKFGLVYKLPKNLVQLYRDFGIDLQKSNGNNSDELPVSATYIADKQGHIVYSYLDADYKKRAETLDLIKVLESLKTGERPN